MDSWSLARLFSRCLSAVWKHTFVVAIDIEDVNQFTVEEVISEMKHLKNGKSLLKTAEVWSRRSGWAVGRTIQLNIEG